jgi:hypothetical protein
VPGDPQLAHGVVGHLLDRDVRSGRGWALVAHPQQAQGPPALRLEAGPQRLRGVDEIEVDAPVGKPRERRVRETHQRIDTHRRVVLDPHDVEVEVARVARGTYDRAVRPWHENVADGGLQGVMPVPRPGRHATIRGTGAHSPRLGPATAHRDRSHGEAALGTAQRVGAYELGASAMP